jgi:hypothetical protein
MGLNVLCLVPGTVSRGRLFLCVDAIGAVRQHTNALKNNSLGICDDELHFDAPK